ncbi:MAG: T9SS type A sorting domain-containing protein [Flavobacteriaceae bacterium]
MSKANVFAIMCFLWASFLKAQIVFIPDVNFKNTLINLNCVDVDGDGIPEEDVDLNDNGKIEVSEAEVVENLIVRAEEIQSLEGIEAFLNLKRINCSQNLLTNLDFSQNPALEEINCFFNDLVDINVTQNTQLRIINCDFNLLTNLDLTQNLLLERWWCTYNYFETIDVSQNTLLKNLNISSNKLSTIDVSQNTALEKLYLNNNFLSSIDVSQNVQLHFLDCSYNLMENLNLAANQALTNLVCRNNLLHELNFKTGTNDAVIYFNSEQNPTLSCIEVDNPEYSYSQSNWVKDIATEYALNCNLSVLSNSTPIIKLYPNPAIDVLKVVSPVDLKKISVFSVLGNKLLEVSENLNEISIATLPSGLLIIQLDTNEGNLVKKVIKL